MIERAFSFVRSHFALLVIASAFAWAAATIVAYRAEEAPPGTKVLRIGHWQLEAGVTKAFKEMAAEYQKLHPDVRIVEDRIPETVYGTWVTTQLMGGTAPDMMEIGLGLPYPIWLSYMSRYFVPLTRYVNHPNPYNKGTEFEDTPLRMTYKDGMRSGYREEMGEYMTIPLAQFAVRIFYNRDLLKELTGLEKPPSDYREFLRVCEQIESRKDKLGKNYTAMSGSKYHFGMWDWKMFMPLTYSALRKVDYNRDGFAGSDELFVAFRTGRIDFSFQPFRARFEMLREVTDHFQTGWTGLTRDDAVFLFAQQRAVFITTGTWDALSLQQQAENRFTVAVMDFPLPAPTDPQYGAYMEGPVYDDPGTGFPFAITRTCKYPDIALDFLLFMASKKGNERLNETIGWIPSIIGTRKAPILEAFEPQYEGIYGAMPITIGGETWIKWEQLYSDFKVKQLTIDEFAAKYEPFYKEQGIKDFQEQQRDWRRGMRIAEGYLAGIRARALYSEGDEAVSQWVKYRALTATRQVRPEIEHNRQVLLIEKGPSLKAKGPYEYGDEVIERVRRRLVRAD